MKSIITTTKNILKKTIVYDFYIVLNNKIFYPFFLKRVGVNRSFPKEKGISEILALGNNKLIVSLTTFPARINYVGETIKSIMHQSYKPNMIILWLSKLQFHNQELDLPEELLNLKKYGLTIKWLEDDIRSYKKLIPALLDYPDDVIVTADDDVYYPSSWLYNLVESYKDNPNVVHCHTSTRVDWLDGGFVFTGRHGIKGDNSIVNNNKLVGVGGVLYPPHCLYKDVTDKELFLKLAPTNDDIWFWAMALANGRSVRWLKNNIDGLYYVKGSQENSDCLTNINDHGDRLIEAQTKAVFEYYGLMKLL